MQDLVTELIKKNLAYQGKNGDIYYRVEKFKNYGKLSGKSLNDLLAGSRVEVAGDKENPLDFVLWKNTTNKVDEISWESPWGKGRPGWHLECSAMSNNILGKSFDIHGGGADLSFPHHENEIAQSEGVNNCTLANYWMHVGFVNIDGEKMSKSLNNFFTIKDVLNEYDGEVIRYFIISSHYRSPLNYSKESLDIAKNALTRLYTAIRGVDTNSGSLIDFYVNEFNSSLDDDFNTPQALAALFKLTKEINTSTNKLNLAYTLKNLGKRLGILQNNAFFHIKDIDENLINEKISLRFDAKNNKNYIMADKIRDELKDMGVVLEDTISGTIWRKE